ncbi:MAG: hypothetical protein A2622_09535 [Bdellovibrionales bacterium RIFCSPHIGHO2_01_FULL_40_29]|nr:MAG: hypothetical protein A2622_09535 [Bdellovibrionales bacterium RIFCSPHIGHO2_01_FULL_40_29]OFZ33535.1 MAG: hypothetical protein A3D17_00085 [Bdellovibrionales bacterium RIFCSPHIGHO2_02_FULL_40_15]
MKQMNFAQRLSITFGTLLISTCAFAQVSIETKSLEELQKVQSQKVNLETQREALKKEWLRSGGRTDSPLRQQILNLTDTIADKNRYILNSLDQNRAAKTQLQQEKFEMSDRQATVAKRNAPWAYSGKISTQLLGPAALIGLGTAVFVNSSEASTNAEELVKFNKYELRSTRSNYNPTAQTPSADTVQKIIDSKNAQ